jgi:hypothetical protein
MGNHGPYSDPLRGKTNAASRDDKKKVFANRARELPRAFALAPRGFDNLAPAIIAFITPYHRRARVMQEEPSDGI